VVLVAIEQGRSLIVPRGDVVLPAEGRHSLFAAPSSVEAARGLLGRSLERHA
jgi:Trk K+ transport system NAD-binding subunit